MFDGTQTKPSGCSPNEKRMPRWLENEFFEKRNKETKLLRRYNASETLLCYSQGQAERGTARNDLV